MVLCKPKLLPLKSLTLEKLEKNAASNPGYSSPTRNGRKGTTANNSLNGNFALLQNTLHYY